MEDRSGQIEQSGGKDRNKFFESIMTCCLVLLGNIMENRPPTPPKMPNGPPMHPLLLAVIRVRVS
jgi:hypothetical protein